MNTEWTNETHNSRRRLSVRFKNFFYNYKNTSDISFSVSLVVRKLSRFRDVCLCENTLDGSQKRKSRAPRNVKTKPPYAKCWSIFLSLSYKTVSWARWSFSSKKKIFCFRQRLLRRLTLYNMNDLTNTNVSPFLSSCTRSPKTCSENKSP